MRGTATTPQLMRPQDAAERLAISTRTLWKLTNMRAIPAVKIGRVWRYVEADLAEWIERHKKR